MLRWIPSTLFAITAMVASAQNTPQIKLVNWATGITQPTDLAHCGDSRLFVTEQPGTIKIITDSMTVATRPFLDITTLVNNNGNEQGLLGMTFDPDYANNGYFYVNYIFGSGNGSSRISRWTVSSDPDSADVASEVVIYSLPQPYSNHNGGDVDFGPDGYLYIGFGDGGSGGDPQGHGQNLGDALGDMIRIIPGANGGFTVPSDNPWVNANPNDTLPEIWASGLRNPYRFGFDRVTGDLWIGDVGQNAWEEVDFWPAGDNSGPNFGWHCYEGDVPYDTQNCQGQSFYVDPVYVQENVGIGGDWCSSMGGRVYRGTWWPHLEGIYLHEDYCAGDFLGFTPDGNGGWNVDTLLLTTTYGYTGIMEDLIGELYVVNRENGQVKKIQDKCPMEAPVIDQNGALLESTTANGYQWYRNGSPISGAINQTYTPVQGGDYYVVGAFSGGCNLMSNTITVIINGVPEIVAPSISVAPNPASDRIDVSIIGADLAGRSVIITDAAGRVVSKRSVQAKERMSLDVSSLSIGTYALQVVDQQGLVIASHRLSIVR